MTGRHAAAAGATHAAVDRWLAVLRGDTDRTEPARNVDYTRVLARVLHRPAVLPVPPLGPKLLLGEQGARELALLLALIKRLLANPAASTELTADELAAYRHVTVADLEAML